MIENILKVLPKYVEKGEGTFYLSISHMGKIPVWCVNYRNGGKEKLFEESVQEEDLENALIITMGKLLDFTLDQKRGT